MVVYCHISIKKYQKDTGIPTKEKKYKEDREKV